MPDAMTAAAALARGAVCPCRAVLLTLGQVDTRTFGLNLYYLIGLFVVGAIALVLAFFAWTALRAYIAHRRSGLSQQRAHEARRDAAGKLLPPADRGLCDNCGHVFQKVYYLPEGRRLCEACYRRAAPPTGDMRSDHEQ